MRDKRLNMLILIRIGFLASMGLLLFGSFVTPSDIGWDKVQHFLGYYITAFVGSFAFPKTPLWLLAIALALLGAAIEGVQEVSIVDRDADPLDWLSDVLGILAALVPLWLAPLRMSLQASRRKSLK